MRRQYAEPEGIGGKERDPANCVIEFEIERHGGTVMGSSRAERQGWRIDLKNGTASHATLGYKQLYKQNARLDIRPVVKGVVEAVKGGPGHDYEASITWIGQTRFGYHRETWFRTTAFQSKPFKSDANVCAWHCAKPCRISVGGKCLSASTIVLNGSKLIIAQGMDRYAAYKESDNDGRRRGRVAGLLSDRLENARE